MTEELIWELITEFHCMLAMLDLLQRNLKRMQVFLVARLPNCCWHNFWSAKQLGGWGDKGRRTM